MITMSEPAPKPAAAPRLHALSALKMLNGIHAACKAHKIGTSAYRLLALLHAENRPVQLKELSEKLEVTTAGITTLADALENKGLAVRLHSLEDRRVITLETTAAGRSLFA
jgi:DNA-binding MarR family transcriptional regulator